MPEPMTPATPATPAVAVGAAAGAAASVAVVRLIAFGVVLVLFALVGILYSRLVGSQATVTTTKDAASQSSEKITKTKNVPSDAVLTVVLATGAALVLVGALYSRIATIKLPGGVELRLSPKEREAVMDKVTQVVQDQGRPPQDIVKVTADALIRAADKKAAGAAQELSEVQIEQVVEEVTAPNSTETDAEPDAPDGPGTSL